MESGGSDECWGHWESVWDSQIVIFSGLFPHVTVYLTLKVNSPILSQGRSYSRPCVP